MKKYIISGFYAVLLLAACTAPQGSQSASSSRADDTVIQVPYANSLADLLARAPGVYVEEAGPYSRVFIRGRSPLFIVDGVRVGHSYAAADSAVNVHDIASVEVLRNASETAIYGVAGRNGVILIHT